MQLRNKLTKKFLYIGSAAAFVAALILYLFCVDPSASLWDCPEYVTSAATLEVGHPPGNPTWMLAMNFLAGFVPDPAHVALAVNVASGIFTALAVALLFQTIFFLLGATAFKDESRRSLAFNSISSLCGALVFAWSDSTIFSAVEAEVYALSLLSTSFMVWLMLKWAIAYLQGENKVRYIILLGYVAGLSFGIHELSLLTLTTLFLIYVFTRHKRANPRRSWLAVILSFVVIGFILLFWLPGVIKMSGLVELLSVNDWGWKFNRGALLFIGLLFVFLLAIPLVAARLKWRKTAVAGWSFFFFMVGTSTYFLIPIRAAANPPMNQVDPSTPFSFYNYFTREQYGSKPLFYGRTPFSSPLKIEEVDSDGKAVYNEFYRKRKTPRYAPYLPEAVIADRNSLLSEADSLENVNMMKKGRGYVKYGYNFEYAYEPELNAWFPRIMESSPGSLRSYADWAGMTEETMDEVAVSGAVDSLGKPLAVYPDGDMSKARKMEKKRRPTYLQQLRYMLGYQIGYMYLRYLMWNFSGRQNNMPSGGEVDHGNFITGIPPLDNWMIGGIGTMPPEIGVENRGYNRYFMLPLLFGLLGAIGICRYGRGGRRASTIVLSLFLMTGVAIVFYLNQSPNEPRERDYAFLGSFYAYSIWIGFGAAVLLDGIRRFAERSRISRKKVLRRVSVAFGVLICLGLPALVLSQTYDDHNRSGRDSAEEIAVNFLNSLDRDAILIVEGDNRYFPLVYAQEVLGVRRDVNIVLQSYLSTPWHITQLLRPGQESKPVPLTAGRNHLLFDAFPYIRIGDPDTSAPGLEALVELYNDNPRKDVAQLNAETLIINCEGKPLELNLRKLNEGKTMMLLSKLAIMDLLVSNAESPSPRPVYWQNDISPQFYKELEKYSVPGLYARKWKGFVDDASLSEADLDAYRKFMKMFGGRQRERMFYAEPYVAENLLFLRRDAVMLASRLAEEGRVKESRDVVLTALNYWPYSLVPPQRYKIGGEKVEELEAVNDLLSTLRKELPDDAELSRKAGEVRSLAEKRREEYLRYYNSLPSWRHRALSFPTRSAAGRMP